MWNRSWLIKVCKVFVTQCNNTSVATADHSLRLLCGGKSSKLRRFSMWKKIIFSLFKFVCARFQDTLVCLIYVTGELWKENIVKCRNAKIQPSIGMLIK
jgi:hypothetical protein